MAFRSFVKILPAKPGNFAAASLALLAVGLCGCEVLRTSGTWKRVNEIQVAGKGVNDQSRSYADELHRRLAAVGIPNKVVTFRYSTRDVGLRVFTRSVVIYKDKATPACPYWLAGNMISTPIWLPNGSVEEQIRFATGRAAEIVEIDEPGRNDRDRAEKKSTFSTTHTAGKWETLFRKKHGTKFNPLSAVDRRKMAALKEAGL